MSNSLTRQHFEAFAEAIKKIGGANLRRKVVSFLIPVFQRFNTEFDEERFREAAKAKLQEIVPTSIGPPPPESTWESTGNILADVEEASGRAGLQVSFNPYLAGMVGPLAPDQWHARVQGRNIYFLDRGDWSPGDRIIIDWLNQPASMSLITPEDMDRYSYTTDQFTESVNRSLYDLTRGRSIDCGGRYCQAISCVLSRSIQLFNAACIHLATCGPRGPFWNMQNDEDEIPRWGEWDYLCYPRSFELTEGNILVDLR